MSPEDFKPHNLAFCFPRVSGDEPKLRDALEAFALFSPRERG